MKLFLNNRLQLSMRKTNKCVCLLNRFKKIYKFPILKQGKKSERVEARQN